LQEEWKMAAEKLTKLRLIQIFIMMLVLVTAFIWRTLTYDKQENVCTVPNNCTVSASSAIIDVVFINSDDELFTYDLKSHEIIDISIVKGKGIITRASEQWNITSQSTELTLQLESKQSNHYLTIRR